MYCVLESQIPIMLVHKLPLACVKALACAQGLVVKNTSINFIEKLVHTASYNMPGLMTDIAC